MNMRQMLPLGFEFDGGEHIRIETAEGPLFIQRGQIGAIRSLNASRCEIYTTVGVVPAACSAESVARACLQHRIDQLKAHREQKARLEKHKTVLEPALRSPHRGFPGALGDMYEVAEYDDEAIFNEEIAALEAKLR